MTDLEILTGVTFSYDPKDMTCRYPTAAVKIKSDELLNQGFTPVAMSWKNGVKVIHYCDPGTTLPYPADVLGVYKHAEKMREAEIAALARLETQIDTKATVEDSITILWTEPHKLAAKQFIKTSRRSPIQVKPYDAGSLFTAYEPIKIHDIHQLSTVVTFLETQQRGFVIRGAPVSSQIVSKLVARKGSGEGAKFKGNFKTPELGRHYIEIDVDKFALPRRLKLTQATVHEVIDHVVHALPSEFHEASYHWQLSSSAGVFDKTKVSMHLWFWLNQPVPDKELKRWAHYVNTKVGATIVDPTLFQHVQAHYTAAPIFEGMSDPFPIRSGLVQKQHDSVSLVLPQTPIRTLSAKASGAKPSTGSSGAGFEFFLSQIGDHPGGRGFHVPTRDAAASYVGSHGTEGTDPELLFSILRDRILSADASHHSDADIEQRASREHIEPIIRSAIEKFGSAASERRKSRRIEGLAPHYQQAKTEPVDIQQAMSNFLDEYKW